MTWRPQFKKQSFDLFEKKYKEKQLHDLGLWKGFHGGSDTKESTCNTGDASLITGSGRSPGEGNTYPSILAWRFPWTEAPNGLQFMGLQRVEHCRVTNTFFSLQLHDFEIGNDFLNKLQIIMKEVW